MNRAPVATPQSCAALNLALVCQTAGNRVSVLRGNDDRCACADRNTLIASPASGGREIKKN
jgi:hypothetical protein